MGSPTNNYCRNIAKAQKCFREDSGLGKVRQFYVVYMSRTLWIINVDAERIWNFSKLVVNSSMLMVNTYHNFLSTGQTVRLYSTALCSLCSTGVSFHDPQSNPHSEKHVGRCGKIVRIRNKKYQEPQTIAVLKMFSALLLTIPKAIQGLDRLKQCMVDIWPSDVVVHSVLEVYHHI